MQHAHGRCLVCLQNAFWLRKLLYEAAPGLLLEHGDKFEVRGGLVSQLIFCS